MRDEFRMTIERRSADGEWTEFGTVTLSDWEREQLALLLSGVDLSIYATMSPDEQGRVRGSVANGSPPYAGLN